jgi:hypothetical protein
MRTPTYTEYQQVISFAGDKPRIAWVSAKGRRLATVMEFEGRTTVFISDYEDERDAGSGSWVNVRKVQPFTPELWQACERWMQREEQQADDLRKLAVGKVVGVQIAAWEFAA